MGKVLGISDLPVANPFPSVVEEKFTEQPVQYIKTPEYKPDVFIKKTVKKPSFFKNILNKIKHK